MQSINLLWFKRDLRLSDHLPLQLAIEDNTPLLLIYIFEPSLVAAPEYDVRHWRFVWESLEDLNNDLKKHQTQVCIFHEEVLNVLEKLQTQFSINKIFSHEETGIKITYERDKTVASFCKKNKIQWVETQTNAVVRGLKNRFDWNDRWKQFMTSPLATPNFANLQSVELSDFEFGKKIPDTWKTPHPSFQKGGTHIALRYMNDFFENRIQNYSRHISKPLESRKGCSRLSPYITWGNLSLRQIFQTQRQHKTTVRYKGNHNNFESRLHWHCHFIQKFEMEDSMEFENLNRGYNTLERAEDQTHFDAWKNGMTGYPMIDACMHAMPSTNRVY